MQTLPLSLIAIIAAESAVKYPRFCLKGITRGWVNTKQNLSNCSQVTAATIEEWNLWSLRNFKGVKNYVRRFTTIHNLSFNFHTLYDCMNGLCIYTVTNWNIPIVITLSYSDGSKNFLTLCDDRCECRHDITGKMTWKNFQALNRIQTHDVSGVKVIWLGLY